MKTGSKKGSAAIIVVAIILSIVVTFAVLALIPKPQNFEGTNPLRKDGELPILVAHRGGDGEFPGNTLEAFYNAYGVDTRALFETDVNLTSDGVLILCHDTTLDGTTNVSGEVIDWSYADLISQKVNFGYDNGEDGTKKLYTDEQGNVVLPTSLEGYPEGLEGRDPEVFLATTLEDLLKNFPETIISVEIKQGGDVGFRALEEALRLVREYDAFDRVIFASFHDEIYAEYKRLAASDEVPDSFMFSPSMGGAVKYYVLYLLGLDVFFDDAVSVFQIPMDQYGFNLSSERIINNAHKHNIAVHYWTINDVEDMYTLVERGADAIMTDYPHKLAEVYESYGK